MMLFDVYSRDENRDCRDVERYDPFVNKWTTVAPMIYARNRLGVGTIDHCIYAVGGSFGQQLYSSVERYSPTSEHESWTEVASMHIARIGLAVCTHTRLLYAIGGFDGHRRLNDIESYNPDTNTWKREKPLLIGRSGAAAASLAQCIYVVGGYASDIAKGPMQLNSVERYDTITEQWSFVRPLHHHRSALSCVALDNRLFAMGNEFFRRERKKENLFNLI
jgi:kelch-like protein 10